MVDVIKKYIVFETSGSEGTQFVALFALEDDAEIFVDKLNKEAKRKKQSKHYWWRAESITHPKFTYKV